MKLKLASFRIGNIRHGSGMEATMSEIAPMSPSSPKHNDLANVTNFSLVSPTSYGRTEANSQSEDQMRISSKSEAGPTTMKLVLGTVCSENLCMLNCNCIQEKLQVIYFAK